METYKQSHFVGAFRVEMQRESQKDRTILCKYEPTEPGDYRIEVNLTILCKYEPTEPGDYRIEVNLNLNLDLNLNLYLTRPTLQHNY